jgi:3',5'-cyclic AMP phosphodiesterase CpdA
MTKIALILLAALWSVPHVLAEEKVVGGPYVVNVGQRSATVVRIVEIGQVSLGAEAGKLEKSKPVLRADKVTFTDLKPGTTYYYAVTGTEQGKGSFRTAPQGPASFQFVVYGDTRTRHDVHREVAGAVLKRASPDLILHTGDLVANGQDASLWPIFFDIERDLLRKVAFFPTLGNHERNHRSFYDFFDVGTIPYYSFDWGTSHFIVLDSDITSISKNEGAQEAFWSEQVRWLEEDLKKSQSADLRFVSTHHPPMTAVERRQGENPHMTALMPLFEKYKVTAGFFGHDHNYQHYFKDGVHYFITGGGGAPLYDVDKPPEGITKFVARTENFVVVNVSGKTVRVEAFKPNGQMLEATDLNP